MIDIDKLIYSAIKSKNKVELQAYKNLKAEIQSLKLAKNAKPYDDAAEIQLISRICKKLEDSCKEFSKAGREDLVSEYRVEKLILEKLLPEPVTAEDIEYILYNWSDELNFMDYSGDQLPKITIPKKEMGNAIKHLKLRFPQADGKMISNIVKKYLV